MTSSVKLFVFLVKKRIERNRVHICFRMFVSLPFEEVYRLSVLMNSTFRGDSDGKGTTLMVVTAVK